MAVKASRRPTVRTQQSGRPQFNLNWGQGQWRRGGQGRARGQSSMASNSRRPSGGGRRGGGGRNQVSSGSVNYDPLACYRCGVRGHVARDCPQGRAAGSGNAVPSQRRNTSRFGQQGPKTRGRPRQTRFGGLAVLYDDQGQEYPVDEQGQIYVPYHSEEAAASTVVSGGVNQTPKN